MDEKDLNQQPGAQPQDPAAMSQEDPQQNQPTYPTDEVAQTEEMQQMEERPVYENIENQEKFSSVAGVAGNKKIILAIAMGIIGAFFLVTLTPDTKTDREKQQEKKQVLENKKKEIIKTAEPVVAPTETPKIISQPTLLEPPPVSVPQPPEPPPAPAPLAPQAPSFPSGNTGGGIQPPTFAAPTFGGATGDESNIGGFFSSKEEEEKRLKAKQERRSSNIMVVGGGGGASSLAGGGLGSIEGGAQDAAAAEGPKKSGVGFLGFGEGALTEATLSKTESDQVTATYIGNLNSTIAQGKIIDAVLETAVNTDLPGVVRGMVSRDVYSEAGKNILIPKGSRLIGEYSSQVKSGQVRISIIWSRLIRPDGVDIALESPGSDRLGRAGIAGHLDNKFWTRLGAAFMVSYLIPTLANRLANIDDDAISATTSTATDGTQTTTSSGTVGSTQAQESSDEFKDLASKVIEDSFSESPTITIDQGTKINVMVSKDLIFPNVPTSGGGLLK